MVICPGSTLWHCSGSAPCYLCHLYTWAMVVCDFAFCGTREVTQWLCTVCVQCVCVMDILKNKHPSSHPPHSSTLLDTPQLPTLEDLDITGNHVHFVARNIQGSAGPGGCDALHWQDTLLRFGSCSHRLCDSVADLSRHLANSITDWNNIKALLANHLIALDKCPGVWPIGVGETLHHIISKTICLLTWDDAEQVCGSSQLCAGVKCGTEGAIHAARELFESNDYGLLVMDTQNTFNLINRTCPLVESLKVFFNTYRGWSSWSFKTPKVSSSAVRGSFRVIPYQCLCMSLVLFP